MDPSAVGQQPPHGVFGPIPSPTLGATMAVLIIAALLVLGILLFWLWRRSKRRKPPLPEDPWQLIKSQVEGLIWSESDSVEFFGRLSALLREALEYRYQKPFHAWTAAEVRSELQARAGFSSDFQAECAEFIKTAEQVIYAGRLVDQATALMWKEKVSKCLDDLQQKV